MVDHQSKLHRFSPLAQLSLALPAPIRMTGEKRSIRQISGNLPEFQAAISELTDPVAASAGITRKPEVMPPGWQIAPEKRPCIDWSGQLLDCRQTGSYPETEFWETAPLLSPNVELSRALGSVGRITGYCQRRIGLRESGGILTQPLLPSCHLFSNMRENGMNTDDLYILNLFNSFNLSA